jgi:hypothetical protein
MMSIFRSLVIPCACVALIYGAAVTHAAEPGFLEGHLKILPFSEVELADSEIRGTATSPPYSAYPLLVLNGDGKREIARITADANGHYRAELPPGDYVLDVHDRKRKHVRAKPKPFSVVPNQVVHVDMDIDTGVR